MKIYYLHLTEDEIDFPTADRITSTDPGSGKTVHSWISRTIDLYSNDWYTNYSVTKSDYGTNLLGDNTWTGMEQVDAITTEAGLVDGNRFIDLTGRIDITYQNLDIQDLPGTESVTTTVDVYGIDDPTEPFPEGWALKDEIDSRRPIFWMNSYRYVRFAINFIAEQDISSIEFDYNIRVEIDKPVMAPMYRRTRAVLDKFPEWMKIRDDIPQSATPALDKPETLGGQLINAVAGEWLNDLDETLEQVRLQRYIATADTSQVSWVYYVSSVPEFVNSVVGDGIDLIATADITEFYDADVNDDVYYWDEFQQNIYTLKEYSSVKINGEEYEIDGQQIWNWFDEHGAIVDLERHRGEDNESFKNRILDVYINRPGVALENFKLALRRELNLWKAFDSSATPDSYVAGATPTILEMTDIENSDEFIDPDGMPKPKFVELVNYLAESYPITWGYFRWNKALWDVGGRDNQAFNILPYRYDATPPDNIQSGIGDGPDLFVYRPDDITGPREFEYKFKIRGRERSERDEWPTVRLDAEIFARGEKEIYDNPVVNPWFTIMVVASEEEVYLSYAQATVQSDADNDNPYSSEDSYYIYEFVGPDGKTKLDQIWFDPFGNEYSGDEDDPFQIDLSEAIGIAAVWGKLDLINFEMPIDWPNESLTMWFSDDDSNTASTLEPSELFASSLDPISIIIRSDEIYSYTGVWESEHQPYTLEINGELPDNAESPVTIPAPTIMWDPYTSVDSDSVYVIRAVNQDDLGNPVVTYQDTNGEEAVANVGIVSVNGYDSWVDGELEIPYEISSSELVEELTFSTNGSSVVSPFPLQAPVWTIFERVESDTRYGVVDENGPWREGKPQEPGAFNFLLSQVDIGRPDFGLSNSTDYVITWLGVDVLNTNRVLVWLESNVVEPATDVDNQIDYPANAITEEWSSALSNYVFEPFFVRARMRPDIEPQWNPQVHSGWFYENDKEYYLYANPITETATATDWTLSGVARQGAPIIVKTDEATPQEYRQVAFFDEATPTLTLMNKEVVHGSGTKSLFVAYENIFDISIIDTSIGEPISAPVYSETNEIITSSVTDRSKVYEIEYKVDKSFYADHEHVVDGSNRTKISIAEHTPSGLDYEVSYEGSSYDPATPVDLPLNTFYTTQDEGFIFLAHDEYGLKYVEAKVSPTKILADGEDYLLISLKSYDEYFNPKANQSFDLTSTFGLFEETGTDTVTLVTDLDGFATAILVAEISTSSLEGKITVDGLGLVDAEVIFEVDPVTPRSHRLVARPSTQDMQADETSEVIIYGRVEDPNYTPVPYAAVAWKRGRSMKDVFMSPYEGQVVADENGLFVIGPIQSETPDEPGYWFMAIESWFRAASPATPGYQEEPDYDVFPYAMPEYGPVGDVVFWNEYPDIKFGVNDANELPKQPIQMEVDPYDQAYYSNENAFPVTYDDATPLDNATPVSLEYNPPPWYAVDRYTQYQLGLLGTGFYSVNLSSLNDAPPDYKDL